MAALHHPHIVPIFAVGCDRGMHYYAMQLIDGCSLAERLRDDSCDGLSPREAARLAMQAAEALEHAHGLGVYRDIKPADLLVEPGGHLWVTDFGLAPGGWRRPVGGSGDAPGTLRYMSPEQAAGGRVLDPRSDVYSLGARPSTSCSPGVPRSPAVTGRGPAPADRPGRADPASADRPDDPARPGDDPRQGRWPREPDRCATRRPAELAEDLRRFLNDRPILARRPGPLERLGRWSAPACAARRPPRRRCWS